MYGNDFALKISNYQNQQPKLSIVENDVIQDIIGDFGLWHLWVTIVIFSVKISEAYHQNAAIFLAYPIAFDCKHKNESGFLFTNEEDLCKNCNEFEYNRTLFEDSVVSEFGLICDRKSLIPLAQSLNMAGNVVGTIIVGVLADIYGRKLPLVISVILQIGTGIGTAFIPNYWGVLILRFLNGVATGGASVSSFVIVCEITGPKYLQIIGLVYGIPYNLGCSLIALFAYYFRDWRTYYFWLTVSTSYMIFYYWLVPESPRYLFQERKLNECAEMLTKAAKQNSLPTENILQKLKDYSTIKLKQSNEAIDHPNFIDLLRPPNLRKYTFILLYNWFACGISFYGIFHYIGLLSGDIFMIIVLSGILGIPGILLWFIPLNYYGRRTVLTIATVSSGILSLAVAILFAFGITESKIVAPLLIISFSGLAFCFPAVYLVSGEVFPTVLRDNAISWGIAISILASMIEPYLNSLEGGPYQWIPTFVFGIILCSAGILYTKLPETKGKPLPDTIEEAEHRT